MKHPLFSLATVPEGGGAIALATASSAPSQSGTPSFDSIIDGIGAKPEPTAPAAAPTSAPASTGSAPAAAAPTTSEPAPGSSEPADDSLSELRSKPKPAAEPSTEPVRERKPGSWAEMREVHDRTKAELATERRLKEELRVALTEGTRKEVAAARAALEKERDEIKAKYDEMETKVRHLDYTSSHDYVDRYQKPIKTAWDKATKAMSELKVDNGDGTRREATTDDLGRILQIRNGSDAREEAKRVFGEDAGDVMAMRRQILDLYESADEAKKEWRTKGAEAQDRARQEEVENNGRLNREFDGHMEMTRKTYPDLYDYDPKDEQAGKYVAESEKFIKIAFKGEGLPEGLSKPERERRIAINQAEIASRARAWGPLALQLKRERETSGARIQELEKQLADVLGTEPKPGGAAVAPSARVGAKPDSFESAIDAIPARRR